jgi:hypothetical protein
LGRNVLPVIHRGRKRGRLSAFRFLLISTSSFVAAALIAASPSIAQTATQPSQPPTPQGQPAQGQATQGQGNLPPINVSGKRPKQHGKVKNPQTQAAAPPAPNNQGNAPAQPAPGPLTGIPMTPLNAVAASSTRLNLPVLETPASVDIVTQQTMQEQG